MAILRTLTHFGQTGLGLKWPNDVIGKDGKAAGILIEATGSSKKSIDVIIGIGINWTVSQKLFEIVENAGAHVFNYQEKDVKEYLSPITSIIPLNFMAYYLSKLLKVNKAFAIGNKVTEVD